MQERRKLCNLVSLQAPKVNRAVSIDKQPIFRFAPSPNGLLHLGHAYSAIKTFELAKKFKGEFYLRIEDIDQIRSQYTLKAAIIRDLHWLGLTWKEPVIYQSNNFEDYEGAIKRLNQMDLLYPCFASRSEIKQALKDEESFARDPDGAPLYPSIYKDYPRSKAIERIKSGEPYSLRLHMDKAIERAKSSNAENSLTYQTIDEQGRGALIPCNAGRWGDVILKRKDTPTSYHLSVVIDDHNLGVTHICRGKDLEASTDIHRILQINLDLDQPIYHHHDLVLFQDEKLAKSKGHPSLFDLRMKNVSPKEIYKAALKGPEALSHYLP